VSSTHITAGGISVALPGAAQPTPTQPAAPSPTSLGGAPGLDQSKTMWIITRGEWDDIRNIAVFAGTEDQVRALVGELEESRKYIDPYDDEQALVLKGDPYGYESAALITTAAEVIGDPDDGSVR
jgi:hypothetical protein